MSISFPNRPESKYSKHIFKYSFFSVLHYVIQDLAKFQTFTIQRMRCARHPLIQSGGAHNINLNIHNHLCTAELVATLLGHALASAHIVAGQKPPLTHQSTKRYAARQLQPSKPCQYTHVLAYILRDQPRVHFYRPCITCVCIEFCLGGYMQIFSPA